MLTNSIYTNDTSAYNLYDYKNIYTSATGTSTSNTGTNIFTITPGPFISISNELLNLVVKEIEKLSPREREIINNIDMINEIIKNNKIKITIEIAEEEII